MTEKVATEWEQMQLRHKYKYMTFGIRDGKQIDVTKLVEEATYDEFFAAEIDDECKYIAYDFEYVAKDGGNRNKLLFIAWVPDTCKIKDKMLYASSKDALKKKLNGYHIEVQANSKDELDHAAVLEKVLRSGTA